MIARLRRTQVKYVCNWTSAAVRYASIEAWLNADTPVRSQKRGACTLKLCLGREMQLPPNWAPMVGGWICGSLHHVENMLGRLAHWAIGISAVLGVSLASTPIARCPINYCRA